MSKFMLWLDCLTVEEVFILFYVSILALGLAFVPVAIWIDKRTKPIGGNQMTAPVIETVAKPTARDLKAAAVRLLYNDNRDSADYDLLVGFIDEVERLKNKYRWIPVEERLPRDSRKVLLYTSHGAVFRGYYDHVWKCWRTTKTVKVTHWRLPDGPGDWE